MATTHIDYRKIDYDQLLDKPITRVASGVNPNTLTTAGVYDRGDGNRFIVIVEGQNISQVIEKKDGYETRSSTDGGTTWSAWDDVEFSKSGDIDAEDVNYDNTTSELTATDVQAAIDEIDTSVDDVKEDITDIQTDITNIEGDITNIQGDITEIKNIIEVETMPTASEDNEGTIIQYKGTTTASFTHGYFYECVGDGQNPETFSWVRIDVQPASSGLTAGAGIDITSNVISADMTTAVYDNTTSGATATNVQDALDEVFQSVSNGKTLIAAAITDKGVPTAASDSFSTMATNIRSIDTSAIEGADIFVPNKLLSTDFYTDSNGAPSGSYYSWDGIINDTTFMFFKICLGRPLGSGVDSYFCNMYLTKQFKHDLAESYSEWAGNYSGLTVYDGNTFITNGTGLYTSLIEESCTSSSCSSLYIRITDYNSNGNTRTVVEERTYDGTVESRTIILNELRPIYEAHIADLTTQYGNPVPPLNAVTQGFIDVGSDRYMAYLDLTNIKVTPPEIQGDNYIELTTSASCTLLNDTPVAVLLDNEENAMYFDSNISIPAGNHTVKVIPYNPTRGRAMGFKLGNGVVSLTHDAPYSAYSTSDTNTGADYKKEFAKNCTTLTSVPVDICTIPDTVTTIGDGFMYSMFEGCTGLTTAPTISISENVTSIGDDYMRRQFYGCTGLTTTATESMGDDVLTIGDYFMSERYEGCTGLTTTTAEVMGDSVTTIGNYFANRKFYGCTSLTTNQEEDLGTSLTTIGNSFRESEYATCTGLLSTRNEVMPNTVTAIGNLFRYQQFRACTNITTVGEEALSSGITSIGSQFRSSQFYGCNAITSITGWRDSSVGGSNYRYQQFQGCNTNKTVKVLTDVGYSAQSSTLNNTYVTEVQVPTTYLNNFTGTTSVYPRRNITDSKFVGY